MTTEQTIIFPAVIDNSMRKELVKCEKAAHYRYEQGLRSTEETRVDIHAGKAFARGMEVMRKGFHVIGMTPYEALQEGIRAVYAEYGSFVPPPKSNKTADRMAGALAFYLEQNPIENDSLRPFKLGADWTIEVSFDFGIGIDHPTSGNELHYCGRFDLLALDADGGAWVVDEKTTSQMGEKWANQWALDSQVTGYCWGAQMLIDSHGLDYEVKGAIINGIAIRLRDYEHGRFMATRQQWEIDRWYRQMRRDVLRWIEAFQEQDHNYALDHACATYNNPCEFALMCKSRNPERIMHGSYVVKRWNPLTREET